MKNKILVAVALVVPFGLALAAEKLPLKAGGTLLKPLILQNAKPFGSVFDVKKPADRSATSVSAQGKDMVVSAQSGDGTVIQFNVTSDQARDILKGNRVWIYGNGAVVVDFPIEKTKQRKVGDMDHMRTSIKVSNGVGGGPGRIDGTTKTWTSSWYDGFTGGVVVFLMRQNEEVLFSTDIRKYGVNGTALGNSSRTDLWHQSVPQEYLNETMKVAIVHMKKPTDRIADFLAKAKEVVEIAKTIYEVISGSTGGGAGTGTTGPTTPPSAQ